MSEILERVSPESRDLNFENHCKVYQFFRDSVSGGRVLDVGCGMGYGSEILSQGSLDDYQGIDYSADAVAYAKEYYGHLGAFTQMDAHQLNFEDNAFDWVISSENLEHLADPEKALEEKARVLKPDGIALIGTPNKEMFSAGETGSPNPYHIDEFYYADLLRLAYHAFESVLIFENTMVSPSPLGRDMRSSRARNGSHGVLHNSQGTVQFDRHSFNLDTLENTHSFMVLAAQPRPL